MQGMWCILPTGGGCSHCLHRVIPAQLYGLLHAILPRCGSRIAALHRLMLHVQGSVVKNDWCRNSTFSPRVAPDFEGKRAATSLSVKFGLQINYRTETRDGDISF
eukprot:scpid40625/ scgid7332/ 